MIKTYNQTFFRSPEVIKKSEFILTIWTKCKYDEDSEISGHDSYTNVESWQIITKEDAEELEKHFDEHDEYHEYLILNFVDGTKSTFRNSHVDLAIY